MGLVELDAIEKRLRDRMEEYREQMKARREAEREAVRTMKQYFLADIRKGLAPAEADRLPADRPVTSHEYAALHRRVKGTKLADWLRENHMEGRVPDMPARISVSAEERKAIGDARLAAEFVERHTGEELQALLNRLQSDGMLDA